MNIKYTNLFGEDKVSSVQAYAERQLNGQDQDRGQIETMEAEIDLLKTALARLLEVLGDNLVLSASDLKLIFNDTMDEFYKKRK